VVRSEVIDQPKYVFQLGWIAHPIFSSGGDYPSVMKERIYNNSMTEGRIRSRLPTFSKKQRKYIQGL
jgi:lactase-phlorizin hydrolase